MKENEILAIEKTIGYTFKDKSLLERAFTHSSVDKDATKNYQSLEFLGDSILDFIVAKRLMQINPDAHEGALTKLRASIVSKEPLAEEITKLNLAKYLKVGKGENARAISAQTKIMSDIFESIVAAIYLDSGDIDVAEKFILVKLADLFNGNSKHALFEDYKTKLNEFSSRNDVNIEYKLIKQSGPPHDPSFEIEVEVNGFSCGCGVGKSKRDAEQLAAKEAIERLKI